MLPRLLRINIANFKEDPFGSGYPEFSEEEILMANPNLIIVGHSDYLNKDLSTRVGWEEITAIQSGNLFFLDENLANNWGTNNQAKRKSLRRENERLFRRFIHTSF